MANQFRSRQRNENRLISGLPSNEALTLAPRLEPFQMSQGMVLYEPETVLDYVYFPDNSVVSLVTVDSGGRGVEAATVGNEGMVGLPVFLGATTSASRAIVQVADGGRRMRRADLVSTLGDCPTLRGQLGRYTEHLLSWHGQSTLCIALHPVQERCARWLLMTQDRLVGNSFHLTHEFLAQMLGVTRPTVSIAANILQRAGLISYRYGNVEIADREGLEAASCACYRIVTDRYDQLLGSGALEMRLD